MGTIESRFNIKNRGEIINKYVLYVEDLHVSFISNSELDERKMTPA